MVTSVAPEACSMPATMAAVWPQLRRNLITLTRGSVAASAAQRAKV